MSKTNFRYRKKPRPFSSCQADAAGTNSRSMVRPLRQDRVDQGFVDALYLINPDGGGMFIGKDEGGLDIVLAIRPDDFRTMGLRWGD
jgi:hypothetical protein